MVIIGTPPELGFLMTTSLIAADRYIIPVFPSGYDLKGLETLTRNVSKVQKRLNPRLMLIGVLIGNFDPRAKLDSDVRALLTKKFGDLIMFPMFINRSVKHRKTTVYSKTISEHAPGEPAAEQFLAVARETITRIELAQNSRARARRGERMEANRG